MKKVLVCLLALIMFVMTAVPSFAQGYECNISVSSDKVNAGENVKVDISLSEGLTGINLVITYDTDKFEFVGGQVSELMTANANTDEYGKIGVAGVTMEPIEAGVLYSFELRVLSSGGEIKTHVKDALDAQDNQVEAQIKDNSVKIKATGTAERSETTTGENVQIAVTNENGEVVYYENANNTSGDSGELVTGGMSGKNNTNNSGNNAEAETGADVTETVTNSRGIVVKTDETDSESKTGLVVALVVGILAIAAIAAIILKKATDSKQEKSEETENGDSEKTE